MIVKAGEIAPARIAAQFDQPSADHDAKAEPTEKPDDKDRRRSFGEWSRVKQGTEEDRQEPRLEQLSFPTERRRSLSSGFRSEEHTSELQSRVDLVCRLL